MKVKIVFYSLFLYAALFSIIGINTSCSSRVDSESFHYGTENDSARSYYMKGFQEILDHGRWTESEKAYRKAIEIDPNYTLGKSLVGRITRDVLERENLLEEVREARASESNDVGLLLDVYLLSMESYNNRDKGIKSTPAFHANRKKLAESNFRKFIHKYPDDNYVKAEYIEWLNAIHGPEVALDSMRVLATEEQMKLGFYISYAASLEIAVGNIDKAIAHSKALKKLMKDSTYTSYLKLKAEILMAQDSFYKAKQYIDRVVDIDPNHIIALGMQSQINNKLADE